MFIPAACSEPHPAKQSIKNKRNKTVHNDFFIGAAIAFYVVPFFKSGSGLCGEDLCYRKMNAAKDTL